MKQLKMLTFTFFFFISATRILLLLFIIFIYRSMFCPTKVSPPSLHFTSARFLSLFPFRPATHLFFLKKTTQWHTFPSRIANDDPFLHKMTGTGDKLPDVANDNPFLQKINPHLPIIQNQLKHSLTSQIL